MAAWIAGGGADHAAMIVAKSGSCAVPGAVPFLERAVFPAFPESSARLIILWFPVRVRAALLDDDHGRAASTLRTTRCPSCWLDHRSRMRANHLCAVRRAVRLAA